MVARTEVEAVGVAGIALVGRTTPIAAVRTTIVERRLPPTGRREEDVVAILLALYLIAIYAIECENGVWHRHLIRYDRDGDIGIGVTVVLDDAGTVDDGKLKRHGVMIISW